MSKISPNFELKKWDYKKEEGIYKKSMPVKYFSEVKDTAFAMVEWLNDKNYKFDGQYKMAYAISHCQVEANPFAFFVINEELFCNKDYKKIKNGRNTKENFYFPSQIIINAKILETPERIEAKRPKRIIDDKGNAKVILEDVLEKNVIGVPEACMSFPLRTQKTKERFYKIKVSYQIPKKILGFWILITKKEWITGLKAHIFQHEVDHFAGRNMYYDNFE